MNESKKKWTEITSDDAIDALEVGRTVYMIREVFQSTRLPELRGCEGFLMMEEIREPEPVMEMKTEKSLTEALKDIAAKQQKAQDPAPKKKGGRPKKSLIPDGIDVDRIIELHKQGWSRERIANNCDCSVNDVITVLREKGVIDVVPAA